MDPHLFVWIHFVNNASPLMGEFGTRGPSLVFPSAVVNAEGY